MPRTESEAGAGIDARFKVILAVAYVGICCYFIGKQHGRESGWEDAEAAADRRRLWQLEAAAREARAHKAGAEREGAVREG